MATAVLDVKPAVDDFRTLAASVATDVAAELQHFEQILYDDWLVDAKEREIFSTLKEAGRIELVCLSKEDLRQKVEENRLLFREPKIFTGALSSITFPMGPKEIEALIEARPALEREKVWRGPPILIQVDSGTEIAWEGNHRTFKVLNQDTTDHPLYAIRFQDPRGLQELFDCPEMAIEPVAAHNGRAIWGTSTPVIVDGERRYGLLQAEDY